MDNEEIKKIRDQIWTTRISRVNAEKRLLNKNSFVQGINIYYSCITIIFSILSVIYNDNALSLITTFMTIALLVGVLYLNSLRYVDLARDYRTNYTQLHKLEFELDDSQLTDERIKQIKNQYCELLDSSCNHISYDYYCTVHGSKGDYREANWKRVRRYYYWGFSWRLLVKVFIVLLPIAVYFMARG